MAATIANKNAKRIQREWKRPRADAALPGSGAKSRPTEPRPLRRTLLDRRIPAEIVGPQAAVEITGFLRHVPVAGALSVSEKITDPQRITGSAERRPRPPLGESHRHPTVPTASTVVTKLGSKSSLAPWSRNPLQLV